MKCFIQAAFDSELKIYRDGAKKELDDIYKTDDDDDNNGQTSDVNHTPSSSDYYTDREKPWTSQVTGANLLTRMIFKRIGSVGMGWDSSYDPSASARASTATS